MSSGYTPKWKRLYIRLFPFLYSVCPEGNYHPLKSTRCTCCDNGDEYGRFGKRWILINRMVTTNIGLLNPVRMQAILAKVKRDIDDFIDGKITIEEYERRRDESP